MGQGSVRDDRRGGRSRRPHLFDNLKRTTFNLSTFQRSRGTRDSSTPQLYIPYYDNNGNIMGYLDESGNTVASYTYDAFGNTISQSGPMSETFPFRFSTKYFDSETGLYYYGYRYYIPILMRWLNRDPIEESGGVNLYAMCNNATLFKIDLLGNIPVKFYTRVCNSEHNLSYKAKVVNRADDIAVTLSHNLPKANGKFIANFQYKCRTIYIWLDILIKSSLQDEMPAGEILRYKITRHGISGKDISRLAMTESMNANTKVLSAPIRSHEIGHAEAFLDIARPMLISKLKSFPDDLSYSQVTEARKIFDQTFESIKGASNSRANAREYNWYRDNGFKVINDTGVSYEVVK